ncbi:MAG: PEP-CTERM sorting domain-containing protein [Methylobacter sp.]|nr:PEP-CTERM sorting domain-containing protein [Methylococcales bacterium]MDD5114078.1 PEP-CTERM sorting domain-containing protein [Methylobacter sp.]
MIKLILSVFLLAAANQGNASTYSFTELTKDQYDVDVIAFSPNGTPTPYYTPWVPGVGTSGFAQAQTNFSLSSGDADWSSTLMDTNLAGIQVGKYSYRHHQHLPSGYVTSIVTGAWMVENKVGTNLSFIFFPTLQLTGATHISDAGQILVTTSNGSGFGMLSVPSIAAVPVPATYTMMLTGLGLFGFMARCRRSLQA